MSCIQEAKTLTVHRNGERPLLVAVAFTTNTVTGRRRINSAMEIDLKRKHPRACPSMLFVGVRRIHRTEEPELWGHVRNSLALNTYSVTLQFR